MNNNKSTFEVISNLELAKAKLRRDCSEKESAVYRLKQEIQAIEDAQTTLRNVMGISVDELMRNHFNRPEFSKVLAVKDLKALTGLGLKECKDILDEWLEKNKPKEEPKAVPEEGLLNSTGEQAPKNMWIDPPQGYLYGFPKLIPSFYLDEENMTTKITNIKKFLIKNGYPEKMINEYGPSFYYRILF